MAVAHPAFELAIIGSGGAAFAAAIAARKEGYAVVMIERGTIGGNCVNTGCIPSKALLAAAEARQVALAASRFPGLDSVVVPVDSSALLAGKQELVAAVRAQRYLDVVAEYGWQILAGTARFAPGPILQVTAEGTVTSIEADDYLVATGSTPQVPPIDGLVEAGYLTSTTATELDHVPASVIVLGGGAVGLEQAQIFARFGSKVTVIEALERLASVEEPEISAAIEDVLRDEGVTVHTSAQMLRVRRDGTALTATLKRDGERPFELQAEQLLVATGRSPATTGLALDTVDVRTGQRGEIVVDRHLRTTNPRVWAAGDVTGGPQFVYVAAAQGTAATENALFDAERTLDYAALPRVTFTSPAIASAGMTEEHAKAAGLRCACRTLPLAYVPRAIVNRDTRGLVKLVADAGSGRLLGAHVIAEGAGEVISAASYAIAAQMTVDQIAHAWSPFLTMTESLRLAAQTFTTDVTKLSCCAG